MTDAAATRAAHAVTHTRLATEVYATTGLDPLKAIAALAGSVPVAPSPAAQRKQTEHDALLDALCNLQLASDYAANAREMSLYTYHSEIKERVAELKQSAILKTRKALAALEQS
jgi:hypothetical protein